MRRRRGAPAEGGFTIAEVLIALMVICAALLGLLAVQVRALSTVGVAGQRQTATGLANRVMEQMRALPYGTVTGGMVCSDLVGDPNVLVTSGAGGCTASFRPSYDASINESVVTTTGSQSTPLNPHVQAATGTRVGVVDYRVASYVTRVDSNPSVDAGYWLTVVATWKSAATKGRTISLASRSQLYSPQGCLSTTTHPFTGPCQPFFYSDAGVRPATIRVDSTRDGQGVVDGLDLVNGTLTLRSLATRVASEQVTSASAQVVTTAAARTSAAGTVDAQGGVPGTSAADTDPATGLATTPTAPGTAVQSSSTSVSASGAGRSLTLTADPSGGGSALATTTSTTTPACKDNTGTAIANGLACSGSEGTSSAASAVRLDLGGTVGALSLGDVAASTVVNRAWSGLFTTGTSAHCTSTSGAGCVAAGLARTLGTVSVGGLPAAKSGDRVLSATGADVTTAIGSAPLLRLSGYSDSAYAESGISPKSSTWSRAGSLTYWNGSGFTAVTLQPSTATSTPLLIPAVSGTYSGNVQITVSGSVSVTSGGVVSDGTAPCSAAACSSTSTAGTVIAQLSYSIAVAGSVVGAFTVSVDLGTALGKTSYKAAPVA